MPVKILMLESKPGCSDGITPRLYLEGQEYVVSSKLAKSFIEDMKVAEKVLPESQEMVRSTSTGGEEDLEVNLETSEETEPEEFEMWKGQELTPARVRMMTRDEMEAIVEEKELPFLPTSNWRDETVAKRIIETMGL